jgi:hypothetical protein
MLQDRMVRDLQVLFWNSQEAQVDLKNQGGWTLQEDLAALHLMDR